MKKFKVIKIVLSVLLLIGFIGGAFIWYSSRPINHQQAKRNIQSELEKIVETTDNVTQGMILVSSKKHDFHHSFVAGEMNQNPISPSQPFHVASIGKAFTSVLVAQLYEEGVLGLDDPIMNYLDSETLDGLYVFENIDYREKVTVRMLLNHTSGAGDYFEDPVVGTDPLIELTQNEPEKFWTPDDLIEFTRNYQSPVAKPGEMYHYSDTGYILLGKIIENTSGMTFGEALNKRIFTPLNLEDTYLMFYDHAKTDRPEIADVWLDGVNVKDYNSLSIDWSGGGLISTLEDLETFIVAVYNKSLIHEKTLKEIDTFDYEFEPGINYGLGMMEIRFKDLFFMLDFLPDMKGHMGVLGTNMFYDPVSETVYISSFGSTNYTEDSVRTLISVLSTLERIQ